MGGDCGGVGQWEGEEVASDEIAKKVEKYETHRSIANKSFELISF